MKSIFPQANLPIQLNDFDATQYFLELQNVLLEFTPQLTTFCTDLFRHNHSESFNVFDENDINDIFSNEQLYSDVFRNRQFVPQFRSKSLNSFITQCNRLILPRFYQTPPTVETKRTTFEHDIYQKKIHEITLFYDFIKSKLPNLQEYTCIDLGAGKGYLSAFLGFEKQLSTVAVEASEKHCISLARRLDQVLIKFDRLCYNKYFSRFQERYLDIQHTQTFLKLTVNPGFIYQQTTASDVVHTAYSYIEFREKYLNLKTDSIPDNHIKAFNIQGNSEPHILHNSEIINESLQTCALGLHACGNLSAMALRLQSNACYTVPCCYAHLNQEQFPLCPDTADVLQKFISSITKFYPFYPQNQKFHNFLVHLPKQILSYATMDFDENLPKIQKSYNSFHYRAVLEMFMLTDDKSIIEINTDFSNDAVVNWMHKNSTAKVEVIQQQVTNLESQKWKSASHMLCRQFCGMLFETLVLIDRLLYLKQKNINGSVQSILHGVSARGFCLWY